MKCIHTSLLVLLFLVAACRQAPPSVEKTPKPPAPEQGPAAPEVAKPQPETSPPAPPPEDLLDCVEFTTGGATAGEEVPTIVAIHGLGDSPEGFRGLLRHFDAPARVLVPRGPIPYHRGHSWFDTEIRRGVVTRIDLGQIIGSADRIADLIRYKAGKAVVTGFSQGGILSFVLAVRHPDVVIAAIPIAGLLPEEIEPIETDRRPPVVAFHGNADNLVPYTQGKESVERLKSAGWDAHLKTFPGIAHQISMKMRTALMKELRRAL